MYVYPSHVVLYLEVSLLNSDKSVKSIKGESRPINPEVDRAYILSALSCVDFVVLFDEDSPADLLDEIKPDVYTKGADYTFETLPEKEIMLKNNTKVEFIEFLEGKSTTNIINKILYYPAKVKVEKKLKLINVLPAEKLPWKH